MQTKEIIDALGGRASVAQATGSEPNTVSYWVRRGNIPARHARVLLKLAATHGRDDIDIDTLMPAGSPSEKANA